MPRIMDMNKVSTARGGNRYIAQHFDVRTIAETLSTAKNSNNEGLMDKIFCSMRIGK